MDRQPQGELPHRGAHAATHAAYCRDALRTLLQACPAIDGITFRAHSESGVPGGSYEFWQTVFAGVAECGRRVEACTLGFGSGIIALGFAFLRRRSA